MKHTKKNLNQSANKTGHASQHSRYSIVESFKSMVQSQLTLKSSEELTPKANGSPKKKHSLKKKQESEIFKDMLETNRLLIIVIENKKDKTARFFFFYKTNIIHLLICIRKLLYHFYLKYLKDFLSPKTLCLAIENDLFLFFK